MKKLKGLFKLIRFELSFSAGICVLMGQVLALGNFPDSSLSFFAFSSVFFISASILVSNDFFDLETDLINSPTRPIPSKAVKPYEALILSIVLLVAGILFSYIISLEALIFSIVLAVIGFLYNRKFKKHGLYGNLLVSLSVGMTFIFGGLTVGLPFNEIVWIFALIAALIDLAEEIAADAMDIKGDLLIESSSIAIKWGRAAAIKSSVLIFLIVILISFFPFIFGWLSLLYLIPIMIMDLSILLPALKLLKANEEQGRKQIRYIYLGATGGLIIFLLMRVFGL